MFSSNSGELTSAQKISLSWYPATGFNHGMYADQQASDAAAVYGGIFHNIPLDDSDVDEPTINIKYTDTQEALISKVNDPDSGLWEFWPQFKLALLVDIYGGAYPDVFERDNDLLKMYARMLCLYCKQKSRRLPRLKVNHVVIDDYLQKIQEKQGRKNSISIEPTKKKYLATIQDKYSTSTVNHRRFSNFRAEHTCFLYSNDAFHIPSYYSQCYDENDTVASVSDEANRTSTFSLLDSLQSKPKKHNIGIVVGNGSIFSLLPEIQVDDVIMLDVDSAVHFFLLNIRKMILETDDSEDFSITQSRLCHDIRELEKRITGRITNNFECETRYLGQRHFLYSKSRFDQCKKALQEKELLFVNIDLFDRGKVKEFASDLNKSRCVVTFMNLTNIADYDDSHILCDSISQFRFAKKYKIITTCLVGHSGHSWMGHRCYVSTSQEQLKDALDFSYKRNGTSITQHLPANA